MSKHWSKYKNAIKYVETTEEKLTEARKNTQ